VIVVLGRYALLKVSRLVGVAMINFTFGLLAWPKQRLAPN
jgi:hypothetical protein